ncbi:MAG: hypothetical protein BWX80_03413 [Candidatus Hydrogenedentes bacterium ADurb.Bin101]|nr:MAG: hypothetical protein BWX80_03413 [Candidatus Hydrogenedentes bacterium ADurb.Bin101]
MQLPCYGQVVGCIERLRVRVHTTGRGKVGHAKQFPETFEAMPQHGKTALMLRVQCAAKRVQQRCFRLVLLDACQVCPLLRLRFIDKGQHIPREKTAFQVKGGRIPLPIPAMGYQVFLYGCFKSLFSVLPRHGGILSFPSKLYPQIGQHSKHLATFNIKCLAHIG